MNRRVSGLGVLLILSSLSCAGNEPSSTAKPAMSLSTERSKIIRPGVTEVPPVENQKVVAGQTLYVPCYSHVYTADNAQPLNIASTLFVRNTDQAWPILLTRVEYFDSGGKSLKKFVGHSLKIGPLASMDFFVKENDETGGASPSFVVEWVSTEPVNEPIVEAVMIGTSGTQGISFTTPARVMDAKKP